MCPSHGLLMVFYVSSKIRDVLDRLESGRISILVKKTEHHACIHMYNLYNQKDEKGYI